MPVVLTDPIGYRFHLAGREGDRWEVLRFPEESLRARIVGHFRRDAAARVGADADELARLIDGKGEGS